MSTRDQRAEEPISVDLAKRNTLVMLGPGSWQGKQYMVSQKYPGLANDGWSSNINPHNSVPNSADCSVSALAASTTISVRYF